MDYKTESITVRLSAEEVRVLRGFDRRGSISRATRRAIKTLGKMRRQDVQFLLRIIDQHKEEAEYSAMLSKLTRLQEFLSGGVDV